MKKREKGRNERFMKQYSEIQKSCLDATIEHECKLHKESLAFNSKLEQDRLRFEAELSQRMQQQNQQFQLQLLQQSQVFQAELFKRLFDKKE